MANSNPITEPIVFATRPTRSNFRDLTGCIMGRLTVLGYAGKVLSNDASWYCRCECGKVTLVRAESLASALTKSCGCLRIDIVRERSLIHGHSVNNSTTAEFKTYQSILSRCNREKDKHYTNYGGRGIRCLFTSFQQFLDHVGFRPSKSHSIDRINNNGNYEHGNVRWATRLDQDNNTRRSVIVVHDGMNVCLGAVLYSRSKEYSRVRGLIRKGMDPTEALNRVLSTKAFQVVS